MLERLEMRDAGPAPSMSFEFAPRMNLLAGDNGLGKTFVLDVTWFALTDTWQGYPATPRRGAGTRPQLTRVTRIHETQYELTSAFDFSNQRWTTGPASKETHDAFRASALVFYARVDGGFSIWDPLRPAGYLHFPLSESMGAVPGFHFTPEQAWEGLEADDHDKTVLCNGLIHDWVIWQLQRSGEFEQLTRVLEILSPNPGETMRPGPSTTRISVYDVRDIPTIELPYGTIPIVVASAGMKRILTFAYLLVWMWREHVEAATLKNTSPVRSLVVLVDEVENHLHPQWQRVILPAILRVAKELEPSIEVQLFATTHAPLVLASVEPHFDEKRDALFVFDLEGGRVVVSKAPWALRGTASAWLTSDVFDLAQDRSIEAERAILQAMATVRQPNVSIEELKRIHNELRGLLKETDPFWARWLVRAKQAGIDP